MKTDNPLILKYIEFHPNGKDNIHDCNTMEESERTKFLKGVDKLVRSVTNAERNEFLAWDYDVFSDTPNHNTWWDADYDE